MTDFGLSTLGKKINTKTEERVIDEKGESKDQKQRQTTTPATSVKAEIGTLSWAAPELFKGEAPACTTDVYSFGIILFELLTRQIPYKDTPQESIPYVVSELNRRPEDVIDMSSFELPTDVLPIQLLMRACCDADPLERPLMNEITSRLNQIAANVAKSSDWRRAVETPERQGGTGSHEKVSHVRYALNIYRFESIFMTQRGFK